MGSRKVEKGPAATRVVANVRQVRQQLRLSQEEVVERLALLGRPILKSGLSKIETGERRVDVDDLVALALALQVTPSRLLLGPEADEELIQLTDNPTLTYSRRQAWAWACGDAEPGDAHPSSLFGGIPLYDFQAMNRPYAVPPRLTREQWRELEPWQKRLDELRDEMEAAGLDFRTLVPDQFTYEESDHG